MAVSTVSVAIKPEDGWTLIAESPNWIKIRASDSRQWHLAITLPASGAPPVNGNDFLRYVPTYQSDGWRFESDVAIVGDIYVRTPMDGAQGQPMVIAAVKDQ